MYISRIAKDGREQTTIQHLKECSEYAGILGRKFGVSKMACVSALFHDMGKYSNVFMDYLRQSAEKKEGYAGRGSVIHSTQGAKYIYDAFSKGDNFRKKLACEIIAMCISNHHGKLMDGISSSGETPLICRLESEKGALHYEEVISSFVKSGVSGRPIDELLNSCVDELSDFFDICNHNNLDICFMMHLLIKSIFSCLIDSDRYNAYCFDSGEQFEIIDTVPPWQNYVAKLEQTISTFELSSEIDFIRHDVSEKCFNAAELPKGIRRLNVPTGGGKTLSSLRFSLNHALKHKMDRVIYVIPYLSVLEQTVQEIKKALKYRSDDDYILEHHSNFTMNDNESEAQSHRLLTERWNCPIIITTMVQFLESIYSDSSGDLRKFHNMANSILIFDEVQTLPAKCTHLFNEALNYLHVFGGCSVLLCTATQPPFQKVQRPIYLSVPTDLISDMSNAFDKLKRTRVVDSTVPGGYSTENLSKFIMDKYHKFGNCLVILNTKADVAKLYRCLEDKLKDDPVQTDIVYLSTTLCPAHRLTVINEIKERKSSNTLCISTQLIEAGVDISFDCVIRAVAGLDSIAQAAGRCNRNGEDPNGKDVYIVNLSDENLSMLTDIKYGSNITDLILREPYDEILSVNIMDRFYKEYFYKRRNEMDYPVKEHGTLYDLLSKNDKGCRAYKNQGGKNPPALRSAFHTAGKLFSVIDQRTVSVLVPYGRGETLAEEYKRADMKTRSKLMREMGRYSVNLYPYQIQHLKDEDAIYPVNDEILILDEKHYDEKTGVIFE